MFILILFLSQLSFSRTECGSGFNLFENKCVKIPKYGIASNSNPGWVCKGGYQQKWKSCIKIDLPENAYFLEDNKTWVCGEGFQKYRNTCKRKK